jgi:Sigma-70, region 4
MIASSSDSSTKVSRIQPRAETRISYFVDWAETIPALEADPEEVYAERETFQRIEEILREMNPILRQAFSMSYFEELSNQEACSVLGVSPGTFKARLFRARQELSNEARRALAGSIRGATPSSFLDKGGAFQSVRSKPPQLQRAVYMSCHGELVARKASVKAAENSGINEADI